MKKIFIAILIALPVLALVAYLGFRFWPRPAATSFEQGMMGRMQGEGMGQGMGMMGEGMMMDATVTVSNNWTDAEKEVLRSLWIGSLPPLPPDPSNQYADDPRAAELGHKLFFDARFSSNGQVACATCHVPDLMFTDGRALSVGVGIASRKAMTIIGTAYSPWLFWDGRADSQWAQALGPLENPVEHGGTRTQYAHLIAENYQGEYETIFGPLPDLTGLPAKAGPVADPEARAAWDAMTAEQQDAVNRIYANMGKAIAAYERLILPGPSRFDAYVEAVLADDNAAMEAAMTPEEVAGLRLFIGDGNCIQCHNGPLFTDMSFHNTGVPPRPDTEPDPGRQPAVATVLADPFNCLGPYSDAQPADCAELAALQPAGDALAGAFKPPTLRNVAETAPYMHAGQYPDLFSVVRHYRHLPPAAIGQSELKPLSFMHNGMMALLAFLPTLSGPLDAPPGLLAPPVP